MGGGSPASFQRLNISHKYARLYFHFLLLQLNLFLLIFVSIQGGYLSSVFFPCFSVQLAAG